MSNNAPTYAYTHAHAHTYAETSSHLPSARKYNTQTKDFHKRARCTPLRLELRMIRTSTDFHECAGRRSTILR
eukprot:5415617-Pleurochrysis_carterae.AAC.2